MIMKRYKLTLFILFHLICKRYLVPSALFLIYRIMRDGEIDIQQPLGDESDNIIFYTTILLRPTTCIVVSTETVSGSSYLNAVP